MVKMRPAQVCCKLLQRRAYTCLSTRAGIWFCLGGLIVLGISAFQFGELFLEWSMQKYKITFSSQHDNIAGQTFEERLCLPGPIDVVYTWVNGSDPQLIKQLNQLKTKLMVELNTTLTPLSNDHKPGKGENSKIFTKQEKSTKSQMSHSSEEKFKWKEDNVCPYPNCVPFHAVAIAGLPLNITEFKLSVENQFLPGYEFSSFVETVDPSIKVLVFADSFNFDSLKNKTITFEGKKTEFTQVYISSSIRLGAKKLDGIGIINYIPPSFTPRIIEAALNREQIVAKVTIVRNISIIKFKDIYKAKHFLGPLRGRIMLQGKKFRIFPSTFIWKPLTQLERGRDILEEDISSSRFADNDELKYSLRSVEKYAPWVRKIYIVTNGQIPSWLNLDHPRIKIVTHEELFVNKSHLPTFSSPAIETHIHSIPGLSKQFIYMNDDVFFGDYVWPDDFYTHAKGQKVYLTWPVPNCNEGCPATWINDKYCDKPCNVSECDWDGGDCLNPNAQKGLTFRTSSFLGSAYSAVGEYCNGGCANSWIGDRYCDANCNVPDCGFDAGDCGLQKFKDLFSVEAAEVKGFVKVPVGIKAAYLNFSNLLGEGVLTEGEFVESSVIRTATFSKKFKILMITLYSNFTDTVPFKVNGFKDINETIPVKLSFNVSVDTANKPIQTTLRTTSVKAALSYTKKHHETLFPYTVYDPASKNSIKSASKEKQQSKFNNETMNRVLDWYKLTNRDIPVAVLKELNKTETEWSDGDLTQLGYDKRKFQVIYPLFEAAKHLNAANRTEEIKKSPLHRVRRHLLSAKVEDKFQYFADLPTDRILPTKRDVKHIGRPIRILDDHLDGPKPAKERARQSKTKAKSKRLHQWLTRYGRWDPISDAFSTSPLRWERQHFFGEILSARQRLGRQEAYMSRRKPTRVLLDTFASSLLHVSRIYNREFGYEARKVPAHMPHFINVDVVNEMQSKFWSHFDQTSSHRIRSPNDMQFAFAYSYYLMDLPASMNMSSIFHELDTDHSGTLKERELRTLAARMFSLPLQSGDIQNLEEILTNCSGISNSSSHSNDDHFASFIVTPQFFIDCKPIEAVLKESFKKKQYKFELLGDEDVTFKMIRNNVSHLIFQLDWIRKNRRKFVCLNDNINHELPQAKLVRTILRDFLESLFPEKSQFELPQTYRNKFLKVDELNKWREDFKKHTERRQTIFYVILFAFVIFILKRQIFRIFRAIVSIFNRRVNSLRGLNLNNEELIEI